MMMEAAEMAWQLPGIGEHQASYLKPIARSWPTMEKIFAIIFTAKEKDTNHASW
jgi:hypothetical protein